MWSQRPSSKRIQDRDLVREHLIHREKLCRVSSRINNSPPRSMTHVKKNLKGRLLEKDRKENILNSNKILVDKLMRVNSRDSSTQRWSKRNSLLNRVTKYEEVNKITCENYRILDKIKNSKPHYSFERLRKDYNLTTKIKNRISQNSGRVPKILNYTQIEFNPDNSSRHRSVKNLHRSGKLDFII